MPAVCYFACLLKIKPEKFLFVMFGRYTSCLFQLLEPKPTEDFSSACSKCLFKFTV